MNLLIRTLGVLITLSVMSSNSVAAEKIPLPQGWVQSYDERKNAVVYQKEGDTTDSQIKIYPSVLLERRGIDQWLSERLNASSAPKGSWLDDLSITRYTANLAAARRSFTTQNGQTGYLEAFVFSIDQLYVRFGVFINTQNRLDSATAKEATGVLATQVSVLEKNEALAQKRGSDIEITPPNVAGITQGKTALKPGRYVGSKTNPDGKVLGQREIMVYQNGEYEYLNKDNKAGNFLYSQATGRLNMGKDCYNSTRYSNEDYCVYGIDEDTGQPTIYARDGRITLRMVWTNEPDRLPQSQREELEKLQRESEKRYKYTTNPGDGIRLEDIETVLYTSELKIIIGGVDLESDAYVLMKDGRVIDNIPVAPFMLDVAKSRSREPDRWGWWKRQNANYSFAWNIDQKSFVMPSGTQVEADPFETGEKLSGTWKASKSFDIMGTGSTSFWGVTFTEEGRFEKWKNTITSAGGEAAGLGPLVTSVVTDEGSATVISGSNIGGGFSKDSNRPKSEREGTYEFDEFNLTLTYDDGRVSRFLTFSTGEDHNQIWFEGSPMLKQ